MLKGYLLIRQNAEGVHGKRKVGNPWYRLSKCITFTQLLQIHQLLMNVLAEMADKFGENVCFYGYVFFLHCYIFLIIRAFDNAAELWSLLLHDRWHTLSKLSLFNFQTKIILILNCKVLRESCFVLMDFHFQQKPRIIWTHRGVKVTAIELQRWK